MSSIRQKRRAVVAVESAIVLPVALAILIAIVAGALMVATYQQVAAVCREATRYASVHGYEYSQSTGNTAATSTDVYNNVIQPRLINMDATLLTYSVSWSPDNHQGSTVTVSMSYQLSVPLYGTVTLSSSSTSVITW